MTGSIRPLAVIVPTASGKSELALILAQHCGGEIVNVDAMQLYRGMDIGTAKLNIAERKGIPHYQLDTLAVTETASVAQYQQSARADIDSILQRGLTPIIVGGSMMYVQSLVDDWAFPATDAVVRSAWESRLESEGVAALHAALNEVDPIAAQTILPTDGRRIVRALEVIELTGQPFAASAPVKGEPRWGTVLLGVDRETEELDRRIEIRTAQMFSDGLIDEVESLIEVGLRAGVTAPRAIGYAQVLAALDGEYGMDSAQEITTQGTKRYVRRQRSWFRRDSRVHWLDASGGELLTQALGVIEQNHYLRS